MTTYRNITVRQLPEELRPKFENWELNESDVEVFVRYYKRLINLVQTHDRNTLDYLSLRELWRQFSMSLRELKHHCTLDIHSRTYDPEELKDFFDSKRTSFDNKKLLDEFIEIYYEWMGDFSEIWIHHFSNAKCQVDQDYFEIRNSVEEYRDLLDSLESMSDKLKKGTDVSGHEVTLCINSLFQVTKTLRFLCSFESSNDNATSYKSSKDTVLSNVNSNIACPENTLIISLFHQLSELYFKENNINAANTYQNVVQELSKCPDKITSGDDFDGSKGTKLKGIGKKTCEYIDEILQTGNLEKVKEKVELLYDTNEPSDNCNDDMSCDDTSCDDMSCESVHDEDIEEVKMEIKELDITDDVISLFEVPDEAYFKTITVPLLLSDEDNFFIKDVCIEYNFERLTTKNLQECDTESSNWNTRPDKYTSSLSTPGITKKFFIEHTHDLENLCSIGREWLKKYDSYYARIFKENNYDPGTIEAFLLFEPIESTSINFLLDCEVDNEIDIISTENSVVHRTQIICSELLLTMNASHTKMISVSSSPSPIECSKKKCVGAREFNCNLLDTMDLDNEMCYHYSKWKVCNKPIDFEDKCRSIEDNQICSKCKIIRCVDCCYKIVPFFKNGNKYTCGKCKQNGLCVFCMPEPEEIKETELISCDESCNNTYCIDCIRDYDISYFKCTYCSTSYCSLCFIECPGCLENVCKDCMYERGGSFYCPCCKTNYCPGCQQTIQIKCAGCDRNVCTERCIEISCDGCGSGYCTDCNENTFECLVCQNDVCEKCWDKDNNCCNSCTQNQDSNV